MRGKVSFVYLGFSKSLAEKGKRGLTTHESEPMIKSKPRRMK